MFKPKGVMFFTLVIMLIALNCSSPKSDQPVLNAELPLHLEEHISDARIVGSEVPTDLPAPVEWRFDEPQPDWKPVKPIATKFEAVKPIQADDALRLPLNATNRADGPRLLGMISIKLPDWNLEDWAFVEVKARTSDAMRYMGLMFNYTEDDRVIDDTPFYSFGDYASIVTDGSVITYKFSLDHPRLRSWKGPWTDLGFYFNSQPDIETATLDLLSVRVIPREAEFTGDGAGVREVQGGGYAVEPLRRALFMHAPGTIAYRVRIPEDARLDVGLGVLRDDAPVTFAITATQRVGVVDTLLEEAYADREHWGQRSVDLSHLAGETVTLTLEATSERQGMVALWASPTLSGPRATDKPNVIFYVIDGAGAEYMSVYGYNRRTTPNLERLAAEGAVFERAYSNSSWTRPSTASFMTSLQHSVLGGERGGFNVVPKDVPTMAQHLHRAGYQTSVLIANPMAGRISGLEREVDMHQEGWAEFSYSEGGSGYRQSSRYLHAAFWDWREAYPAEPYWVHFQTTDIHEEVPAVAPFSGLFVAPDQQKAWVEWRDRFIEARGSLYSDVWERIGVNRAAFFNVLQGIYDENMAHNDYQIGRLVERLKAMGEWENTLLIVASDHSIHAAAGDIDIAIQETLPPHWYHRDERPSGSPLLRPAVSRIPLMFVWQGHIIGGQRFSEPVVSMIDVLPTVLDLVGLSMPDVMQGQSLAPLLLGTGDCEQRPVILDEFYADSKTGELHGFIEVIDGRWGASLEINPNPDLPKEQQRPVPLLLYDLWNDPYCLHIIHEERPDLVEKYTAFLEAQFEAHKALAQMFTPSKAVPLTPEQLKALRALGYIR